MPDIAVIILTYNEARHLERAIRSLRSVAKEIIVVDSFSTDETIVIAQSLGAKTVQRKFLNQSDQFQWALDNIATDAGWIMRLDADEVLESSLVEEIMIKLPTLPSDVVGINLKRKHIFLGRWIRHGGRYPLTLLRIFKRGHGRIENRWMDEHIIIWGGRTVTFDNDFADHSLNDLTFFIEKHNQYATREAIERLNLEYGLFPRDAGVSVGASNSQAKIKRFLKERLYNRLPIGVGPLSYFLWRYLAQLGFLDGREGLIYHFLQGFWYRLLVEAKVLELRRAVSHLNSYVEIKSELTRLTGMSIK